MANVFDQFDAPATTKKGVGGVVREQIGNAVQAADDIVRLIANGMTLGYADKFAAAMDGSTPEQERAKTSAAQERAGGAGYAASIIGALLPAGRIAKGVEIGAGALKSAPVVGRLAANPYAQSAVTGAGLGVGTAAGEDKPLSDEALVGAITGVGGQALAHGLTGVIGKGLNVASRPERASFDSIRSDAKNAYKSAEDAGVIFSPDFTTQLGKGLRGVAEDFAYEPIMQPKASGFLNVLARNEGQPVTLEGMDRLQRVASRVAASSDPEERKLGALLKGKVESFVQSAGPGDILPGGDIGQAQRALGEARTLYKRAAKGADVEAALEQAGRRSARTYVGSNVENPIRQEIGKMLDRRGNWTPDEEAAVRAIEGGSRGQNALRLLGTLSPDSGRLAMFAHLAAAPWLGGANIPLAALGFGAKHLSEALTKGKAERLSDLIAAGGDASALTVPPGALETAIRGARSPLSLLFTTAGAGR